MEDNLGEFGCRSVRGGEGKVATRLGLDGAEDISRATALILVIPPRFAPRRRRRCRTHVRVQCNWLLVQTYHWLLRIIWLFIDFQDVFPLGDVVLVEIGHAPHFFPATA